MAGRADTKPLGLHGLVHRSASPQRSRRARGLLPRKRPAPRRRSAGRAARCSRRAARTATGPARWLCSEANARTLARDVYRRQRAVLLTAHAHAVEDTDRDSAKAVGARSAKARADLRCRRRRSPARPARRRRPVAQGARASSTRPGAPIRIPNWRRPIAELRSGDSARDRLKRIEALAGKCPAMSKARSRSRAPRSTRRNSPRRAPRLRLISRRRPSALRC